MQVTLTPHGEQLLRTALDRHLGQSAEAIIEEALAERFAGPAPALQPDPVWERLKSIPGLRVPDHWPPQFAHVEPIVVEGEPVSEQLVRERAIYG